MNWEHALNRTHVLNTTHTGRISTPATLQQCRQSWISSFLHAGKVKGVIIKSHRMLRRTGALKEISRRILGTQKIPQSLLWLLLPYSAWNQTAKQRRATGIPASSRPLRSSPVHPVPTAPTKSTWLFLSSAWNQRSLQTLPSCQTTPLHSWYKF